MTLLSLNTNLDRERIMSQKNFILESIKVALLALGYPDIVADFYGVYPEGGTTE